MSNFSFSHSVFKRLVSQGRQKVSLCGNGLTLHYTNLRFNNPVEKPFESIEEDADNQHFFPFPQCVLYQFGNTFQCTKSYPCFLEFRLPILCTIFLPSYWQHVTIIVTMNSDERGMSAVTMTIINPGKEILTE